MKPDVPENQSLQKVLTDYINQAMRLTEEGITLTKKRGESKGLEIPNYLTESLKMNEPARKTLECFSYSNKQDYLEWLGAKLEIH